MIEVKCCANLIRTEATHNLGQSHRAEERRSRRSASQRVIPPYVRCGRRRDGELQIFAGNPETCACPAYKSQHVEAIHTAASSSRVFCCCRRGIGDRGCFGEYLGSAIDARILGIRPPLAPPLDKLSSLNDLERLGRSRAVILVARGYPAEVATSAIRAFRAAATLLLDRYPQLVFFVIDDESNAAAANALLTRLGLEHEAPFAVILDRFIETEEKFLMTQRETPDEARLVSFVSSFVAGKLAPAMLWQPRPPCDRNPDHPALWEVVTDSFEDANTNHTQMYF